MTTYKLKTIARFYDTKDKNDLEALGFSFKAAGYPERWTKIAQNSTIDFHTLLDVQQFITRWNSIILDHDTITIYDDCID